FRNGLPREPPRGRYDLYLLVYAFGIARICGQDGAVPLYHEYPDVIRSVHIFLYGFYGVGEDLAQVDRPVNAAGNGVYYGLRPVFPGKLLEGVVEGFLGLPALADFLSELVYRSL